MADVSDDLINKAFEWIARSSADDFSASERVQLDAWLHSDQAHRTAFELAELTWEKLERIPKSEYSADWFNEIPGPSTPERGSIFSALTTSLRPPKLLAITAAVAAALVIAVLISVEPTETIQPILYSTDVGGTADVNLSDGTVVTLGAESRISVAFSEESRKVSLEKGEAFFNVVSDPDRPFVVAGGWLTVTVVGTAFEVSRNASSTEVAVSEGTVSVAAKRPSSLPAESIADIQLTSGQLVQGTRIGLSDIQSADMEAIGAWRRGELVYVSAALSEILSDADRYYPGAIKIMDQSAEAMTLSLILEAGDTEGLLDTLEAALPIRVSRLGDGTVLVSSDP